METSERNALIEQHLHLVDKTLNVNKRLRHVLKNLPAELEKDDIRQAGYIGLIDAAEKFDPAREAKFATYAEWRIRGAIYDFLRENSLLPRSIVEVRKIINEHKGRILKETGREATMEELRDLVNVQDTTFNLAMEFYQSNMADFSHESDDGDVRVFEIVDTNILPPNVLIGQSYAHDDLVYAMSKLPTDWRLAVTLYYFEDWFLQDIADLLEVTESRASQILKLARDKMKQILVEEGRTKEELLAPYTQINYGAYKRNHSAIKLIG